MSSGISARYSVDLWLYCDYSTPMKQKPDCINHPGVSSHSGQREGRPLCNACRQKAVYVKQPRPKPDKSAPCTNCGRSPNKSKGLCQSCYQIDWQRRAIAAMSPEEYAGYRARINKRENSRYPERKNSLLEYARKRLYEIEPEEYARRRSIQQDCCAVCFKDMKNDKKRQDSINCEHDHHTGLLPKDSMRDLVCGACNKGIGLFDDNEGALMRAADYLLRHRAVMIEKLSAMRGKPVRYDVTLSGCRYVSD